MPMWPLVGEVTHVAGALDEEDVVPQGTKGEEMADMVDPDRQDQRPGQSTSFVAEEAIRCLNVGTVFTSLMYQMRNM
jgi:hypothetical protein